jgi:hypothetical protein
VDAGWIQGELPGGRFACKNASVLHVRGEEYADVSTRAQSRLYRRYCSKHIPRLWHSEAPVFGAKLK